MKLRPSGPRVRDFPHKSPPKADKKPTAHAVPKMLLSHGQWSATSPDQVAAKRFQVSITVSGLSESESMPS